MPADELLDVVEPDGTWVGRRRRDEVHAEGLWHQVFHCLIIRTGPPPAVLLQQRHRHAPSFGGKLDLSATGHLAPGEGPRQGVRELAEELGIEVDPAELVPLGARLLADDRGEGRNRERVHAFLLADDRPLESYRPDPAAVEALVEVALVDLLALLDARCPAVAARRWQPGEAPADVHVEATELVPSVDGYWTVLAVMAERYAMGRRPIAI